MLRAPLTLGAPMLKLPPYLAIAVPVWLVPLTILIIVQPLNGWWEPLAPTQYAAFVLREASYIPVSLDHDGGCGYGEIRAWLRLQQHPQGRIWLDRILKAGPTPAGRVLAEAGLGRLGGSPANSERMLVPDSVRILSDSGWGWWTPAQVREQLAGARLGKHLASAGPCQQWGLN